MLRGLKDVGYDFYYNEEVFRSSLQVGQDVVSALQGSIERLGHKMRIAALVIPFFSNLFRSYFTHAVPILDLVVLYIVRPLSCNFKNI